MAKSKYNLLFIYLGWFFVILGVIGIALPILPTTPFLILALAIFAKCSPRFQQMLLNNRIVGPDLRDWQDHRRISRKSKYKAYILILITFTISIIMLDYLILQIFLLMCMILLLRFLHGIKES